MVSQGFSCGTNGEHGDGVSGTWGKAATRGVGMTFQTGEVGRSQSGVGQCFLHPRKLRNGGPQNDGLWKW